MRVDIDGNNILNEADFHSAISSALSLPRYYGRNLDALFDVLSVDVERPLVLAWQNSSISQEKMREGFARIVDVLRRIEVQDSEWDLAERFELRLL